MSTRFESGMQRPPTATRTKPRRTWGQRFLIGFGFTASLSLVVAALGLTYTLNRYRSITFLKVPTVESAPPGEPVNWLLVGSDSREGIDPSDPNSGAFLGEKVNGKRTDTIMLARIDPANHMVDLLSIPRDLWVPISGTGENSRINSAFNGETGGGEERLVSTVEDVLGVQVNNYAEVNFVGFQQIIDSLGGVPIYFSTPVRDTHSGLDIKTPGCHVLDGSQSLAFARSRYLEYQQNGKWKSDITSDLGRSARQQYLITRIADLSKQSLDLTSLGTINDILTIGGRNLVIDDGASAKELYNLARTFSGVGSEGIRRHALPVDGFVTGGGADVLRLNDAEAQATLDIFRGRVPVDPTQPPSTDTVAKDSFALDVQNGAGIGGLATTSAADLEAAGFQIGKIDNAETPATFTTVRYPSRLAAGASVLGTSLAVAPHYEQDNTLKNVQLVLGPDYDGLGTGTPASPTTTAAPAITTPPPTPENENIVGIVPGPGPAGTPCAAT